MDAIIYGGVCQPIGAKRAGCWRRQTLNVEIHFFDRYLRRMTIQLAQVNI